MDLEQEELQFLGLFGIFSQAYKIILSWRKLFGQITLSLILPLSFIFLAHMEVSHILFFKLIHTEHQLHRTVIGSRRYHRLSDNVSSEIAAYWAFKILYFTFLLVFSLLSTAAVVYTVACAYTGRPATFRKVMSVVPKVWKRLMVTFICTFFAFFVYNVVAVIAFVIWAVVIGDIKASAPIFIAGLILYVAGFVYMTIIWQLASVVSVLEDLYGFKAMVKSQGLIKGKMGISVVIFFLLNCSLVLIEMLFEITVVHGWFLRTWARIGFGVLSFLLLFKLFLIGLVIQTIIYFVCKSYHHENIDKSVLSDHLEVYLGDYVPLKSKDVQLEQYQV